MEHLSFVWFLLMQARQFGLGLFVAALTCAVLLLPDRRRLARLLILPALWLFPLLLGGVFYERDVKSTRWLGLFVLPMLAAYIGLAIWAAVTLPKRRVIAAVCALGNAPFALLSALVVAMAADGTWL